MPDQIFVSYQHRNVDPPARNRLVTGVCDALQDVGHKVWCYAEHAEAWAERSSSENLAACLAQLRESAIVLYVPFCPHALSKGMQKEVAISADLGVRQVMAHHEALTRDYLAEAYGLDLNNVQEIQVWREVEVLCSKIRSGDFTTFRRQ